MMRHFPWLLAALLAACAPSRPSMRAAGVPVDVLVPTGRSLFLLDFAQSRYQRWSVDETCRLADTLRGSWAQSSRWLALGSPGSPFAPVRAAPGPNGHFFVLDRLGRRLCLYDTNAQFLSGLPLPQELRDRHPDRLDVHWSRDGIFTFLDLVEGAGWQFTETRQSGGQGDWRLVNRLRLPLNLESCLWEPYFRGPCCRVKGSGEPRCFDRYFNPQAAPAPDSASRDPLATDWPLAARPDPAGPGWMIEIGDAEACAASRACFHTDKARLQACPGDSLPSGAPPP